MSNPYIITYDNNSDSEKIDSFLEAVRSNFASKIGNQYTILIKPTNDVGAEDIYDEIKKKIDFDISFYVVEFGDFYGDLNEDGWTWLEGSFPYISFDIKDK